MSGFKKEDKVIIYKDEVDKLIKRYKKINKFKKSNIHAINKIDGRKDIIQELMDEYMEDK